MIEINQMYKFKTEFAPLLGIPQNQVDRRQSELLQWLENFFDFKFYDGHPKRILIKEIYGEYQPLPRKMPNLEELRLEKKNKYEQFTIASLGVEFKPNSQNKIARDAIASFGKKEFHHTSVRAVAARYVREPFQQYGETDDKKVWVWYSSYEPLEQDVVENWRKTLQEEHISEQEAANAFYRQEQGEDISKEKSYYKKAQERFAKKYGDIAVLVTSWRLKH